MNLKNFFRSDDRAVSPVLGVALLIAITVILAGVVAFVVLGVDQNNAEAPSASLDFEQNGTDVVLSHTGGSALPAGEIDVKIIEAAGGSATLADVDPTAVLTTGEEVVIANNAETGDKIRVVWNDPNSDREVLLGEYVAE